MQALTQGMDRASAEIVSCLQELLQPEGILARNDASVRKLEGLPQDVAVISGNIPERVPIQMNGLTFQADLLKGQKTGIYLDQRENYLAAARHSRGKVLDCFSSTGGFAIHVAKRAESLVARRVLRPCDRNSEGKRRCERNLEYRLPPSRCVRLPLRTRGEI